MKRTTVLLNAVFLAGALSFALRADAAAQVSIGAHGTITDIRTRTAGGLGGRLTVLIHETPDWTLALDGVGEYVWPSCDAADCTAALFHANLLAQHGVASYAEAYLGLGFTYQTFTRDDGGSAYTRDDVGMNVLVGTQAGAPGGVRPFVEVRFSIMNEGANETGGSLGLRIPLGR